MTCFFYSDSKLALMKCTGTVDSSGKNLRAFTDAFAESCDIFIIDMLDFSSAEYANLFASSVSLTKGLLLRIVLIRLL